MNPFILKMMMTASQSGGCHCGEVWNSTGDSYINGRTYRGASVIDGRFFFGTDNVVVYTDDGININSASLSNGSSSYFTKIGTRIITVDKNSSTNRAQYSDNNGISWTTILTGRSFRCQGIVTTGTRVIAVGDNGTDRGIYSDDMGLTWGTLSILSSNWNDIIKVGTRIITVGSTAANRVGYSDDSGATWTYTAAAAGSWTKVVEINGRLVAVADLGTYRCMYSDNLGVSWTPVSTLPSYSWTDIVRAGNRLIAISTDGPERIYYSDDFGLNWSPVATMLDSFSFYRLAYNNGIVMAAGLSGSTRLAYSDCGC